MQVGGLLPVLWLAFLSHFTFRLTHAQGNGITKCADDGSDWYINAVGETPCKTYERLRQICNNNYRLGTLKTNTPPDYCDDQVADCCCNNIAFTLSMICLTCQVGIGQQRTGVDAGAGAYEDYLTADRKQFCSPQTNRTLPREVQAAVCRNDIKISDQIYQTIWSDGAWFYVYATSQITKKFNALGDGAFTKCPKVSSSASSTASDPTQSQVLPAVTSSDSASSTTSIPESTNSKGIGGAAIAGIVVGVLVAIAAAVVAGLFFWRRRQSNSRSGQSIFTESSFGPATVPSRYSFVPPPTLSDYNYSDYSTTQGSRSHYGTHSESSHSHPVGINERHVDAGSLSRMPSGRLPPAYGEFVED